MIPLDPQFTSEFYDYVKQIKNQGKNINRNLAIMESSRQERAGARIFVRNNHGTVNHDKLEQIFRKGIPILMYNVVRELAQLKFYDAKPPVIYTMMQMWDHVFSKFIISRERKTNLDLGKIVPLDLSVDKIYEKLAKLTHVSNPNCIKKNWIKDALNEYVTLGMATPSTTNSNNFTIKYRKHGGDTREFITKLMRNKENAKPQPCKDGLDKYINKDNPQ